MKQVKLDSTLWVLSTTPYRITQDTDVSIINVHCNYIDLFRALNPSLNLTPYNYLILAKHTLPYYEYLDDKEIQDFTFPESIINTSCFVDETKTMNIQQLALPEDYDGEVSYYLDGVLLDSSSITLSNPSSYIVSANAVNSSIYADDLDSSYVINFLKYKRNATLSFANSTVNVSTYVDLNYFNYVQELTKNPADIDVNYYLDSSKLAGNSFELKSAGVHTIVAAVEDNSIYNDTSASYTINYTKVKRTASISFDNATVEVSTYKDENYSGTILTLTGVPSGVTPKYYLDSSLLSSNNITISSEGNHIVKGAIENHPVYNDVSTSYTISYSKVKRDAILSFADSSVNITVEDETSYSGNVQAVSGLPTGQTVNYYLDSSLLSGNTISISDLQEGENSYTVTAKIENSSYYNDASCSYTLNITCICAQYQKYEIFSAKLSTNTYLLACNNYSNDFKLYFDNIYYINDTSKNKGGFELNIDRYVSPAYNLIEPNLMVNIVKFKLKDNTQSVLLTYRFGQILPGQKGTDVIDIPKTVQTMNFSSSNNDTIKKLIIRSPYLYTGNAPGNVSSNIKIYVPENSLLNYKTANQWKNISTNIYCSDFSKDFLTIRFINDTVDVSTYTTQNYSGTLQDYYGIPNDVQVKLYLDSSLLNSSSYTLTTTGNHTVLAEITNNSSYFDTSTTYTINYQRVKQDVSIRGITFNSQSGQTFEVDEQVLLPTFTYYTVPASADNAVQLSYSFDGTNYVSNTQSQYLDTTTPGDYTYYVKFTIPDYNLTYNAQEFVRTWEWSVEDFSNPPKRNITFTYEYGGFDSNYPILSYEELGYAYSEASNLTIYLPELLLSVDEGEIFAPELEGFFDGYAYRLNDSNDTSLTPEKRLYITFNFEELSIRCLIEDQDLSGGEVYYRVVLSLANHSDFNDASISYLYLAQMYRDDDEWGDLT